MIRTPPSACVGEGNTLFFFYHVLDSHEVLVLPAAGGFHEMVLCELHDGALGGRLGAKKSYVALQKRMWQP